MWSLLGGTGSTANGAAATDKCPADTGNTWPADGHPDPQWTIDTNRHLAYTIGRLANNVCILNVNTSASSPTVTNVSSGPFYTGPQGAWTSINYFINGIGTKVVSSVTDSTHLQLTGNAGTTVSSAFTEPDNYGAQGRTSIWSLPLTGGSVGTNTLIGFSGVAASPFTFPTNFTYHSGSSTYDPVDDGIIIVRWSGGAGVVFAYCPQSGSLTAAQTAIGCTSPRAMTEVTLNAGVVNVSGTAVSWVSGQTFISDGSWSGKQIMFTTTGGAETQAVISSCSSSTSCTLTSGVGTLTSNYYGLFPIGSEQFMQTTWDTLRQDIVLFGGYYGISTYENETWTYSPQGHYFALRCTGSCSAPPLYAGGGASYTGINYYPLSDSTFYHDSSSASSPADYEFKQGPSPTLDTWTKVGTTGPIGNDSTNSDLYVTQTANHQLTMSKFSSTTEIWQGDVTVPVQGIGASSTPACLNLDGNTGGYGNGPTAVGPYTDLVIDASNPNLVSSASHSFTAADVWTGIHIISGTGATTNWANPILSVSGGKATLRYAAGTVGSTGISWSVEGCTAPDADPTNSAVNTTAQFISHYGSIPAGITAVWGYTPANYWIVSPTGNDGTGTSCSASTYAAGSCTPLPFQNCCTSGASPAAGDIILFRGNAGLYANNINITSALNGSQSAPTIFMAYPGEKPTWATDGTGMYAQNVSWIIINGYTCHGCNSSGGSVHNFGGCPNVGNCSLTLNTNNVITYSEITGCLFGIVADTVDNLTISKNVISNNDPAGGSGQHDIYLANHDGYDGASNPISANYSTGIVIRQNILFKTPWDGIHLNGRFDGPLVESNWLYYNGAKNGPPGIQFQTGVKNAVVRSNLLFNNASGIGVDSYTGWCTGFPQSTACPYGQPNNQFINNTILQTGYWDDGTVVSNSSEFNAIGITNGTSTVVDQHIIALNNIFQNYFVSGSSASTVVFDTNNATSAANSTISNTVLWSPGATNAFAVAGTQYTCSGATAVIGTLTGCAFADPQFTSANPANVMPNQFTLTVQGTSPAAGNGSLLSASISDVVGTAQPLAPNIGAYSNTTASAGGGSIISGSTKAVGSLTGH